MPFTYRCITCLIFTYHLLGCLGCFRSPEPVPVPVPITAAEQSVRLLPLLGDLTDRNAELSGLAWYGDQLILLPQYPGRNGAENSCLYALTKTQLLDYLDGRTSTPLQPSKVPFDDGNLSQLIPGFEGYEAIVFQGDRVYLLIEANHIGHMSGYLVAGLVEKAIRGSFEIRMNAEKRIEIEPQTDVSNAAYEAMTILGDRILTFYELNGQVNSAAMARVFDMDLGPLEPSLLDSVEFRLTDATTVDANGRFWMMNYRYPRQLFDYRDHDDRLRLTYGTGKSHESSTVVERLIEYQVQEKRIVRVDQAPLWLELLPDQQSRNWEGLVRLDERGFVICTDKFPETLLGFVSHPKGPLKN